MKRFELKEIIREEIKKVLNEGETIKVELPTKKELAKLKEKGLVGKMGYDSVNNAMKTLEKHGYFKWK